MNENALTQTEQQAIELLEEDDDMSRTKMADRLGVRDPAAVSDIMRSLRYKGEVRFSFETGFSLR